LDAISLVQNVCASSPNQQDTYITSCGWTWSSPRVSVVAIYYMVLLWLCHLRGETVVPNECRWVNLCKFHTHSAWLATLQVQGMLNGYLHMLVTSPLVGCCTGCYRGCPVCVYLRLKTSVLLITLRHSQKCQ
jgi:hypothetical protein